MEDTQDLPHVPLKTGRPTEYTPEMAIRARQYLSECIDEEDEYHKTRGEKSDGYERLIRVKLPTIEGLAVYLKVARSTVYLWKEKSAEFSDTLEELLAIQSDRLQNNGLSGDYNPIIAKLILSANHNMKEKSDVTTNDKDLPTPIANVQRNDSISEDKRAE